jgi:hypothetical protein
MRHERDSFRQVRRSQQLEDMSQDTGKARRVARRLGDALLNDDLAMDERVVAGATVADVVAGAAINVVVAWAA